MKSIKSIPFPSQKDEIITILFAIWLPIILGGINMKSWKWYAKQFLKNPFYRVTKKPDIVYTEDEDTTAEEAILANRRCKREAKKKYNKARRFEKKWGFAYEDCWCLDTAAAKFLYPRLAYLRDNHCGAPGRLVADYATEQDAHQAWTRILDTMARGFYLYVKYYE